MSKEGREIVYSQTSVQGFLIKDQLTTTTERELRASNLQFLGVHVTQAPQTEDYILKGLLGLSTSKQSNRDAFTQIEEGDYLEGQLFMDRLRMQD